MSIKQYYEVIRKSRSNDELISSSGIQLPNPHGSLSDKILTDAIKCANAAVTKAIVKSKTSRSKKGPYLYLTDAQRYEVGKKLLLLEQLMRCDTMLIIILTFH